jgi:hypothetical protein
LDRRPAQAIERGDVPLHAMRTVPIIRSGKPEPLDGPRDAK